MRLIQATLLFGLLFLYLVAAPAPATSDPSSHPLEGSFRGDPLGAPYAGTPWVELQIGKRGDVKGKVDFLPAPHWPTKLVGQIYDNGRGGFALDLTVSIHLAGEWNEYVTITYPDATLEVVGGVDCLVLYDLYWSSGLVYLPRDGS